MKFHYCLLAVLLLQFSCGKDNGTVKPRPPTALLIISEGRSGSSTLMRLLATLPSTFLIAEPFFQFGKDADLAPTYRNFFDCSFLKSLDVAKTVYWSYPCGESPYFKYYRRKKICKLSLFNETDIAIIRQQCLNATVRILKTIRFHDFHKSFPALLGVRTLDVRIIHLIRKPFSILRSQVSAGWHGSGGLALSDQNFTDAVYGRCKHINATHLYLRTVVPDDRVIHLRYEEMILNAQQTVADIVRFINRDCSNCNHTAIDAVMWTKNGRLDESKRNWAGVKLHWENISRAYCPTVYQTHGYT